MSILGIFALGVSSLMADSPKSQGNKQPGMSQGTSRDVTPCAYPCSKDKTLFVFGGDFIYWQASQANLQFAQTSQDVQHGQSLISDQVSSNKGINFTYAPGFKFDVGLDLSHDGWDTDLMYTYLGSTPSATTITVDPELRSLGLLLGLGSIEYPDVVSGEWSLYFNAMDWELGRKFFVSPRLTLRPHIGIKGAWNHQSFNVFETEDIAITLRETPSSEAVYQRQSFWGVGMRVGLNTEWFFCEGLSLYGNFAFAELYGQFTDLLKDKILGPQALSEFDVLNVALISWESQDIHQMQPVVEIALGLRYELSFGQENCYRFLVQAGWEQQIWWHQNQFLDTYQGLTGGDLTLQGLDVKIGFAF